jgi:hypothetical protein
MHVEATRNATPVIQSTFPGDPDGKYRCFFDVIKKDNTDMIHTYGLIYTFTFAKQTDDEEDLEMIFALSAIILSPKV